MQLCLVNIQALRQETHATMLPPLTYTPDGPIYRMGAT